MTKANERFQAAGLAGSFQEHSQMVATLRNAHTFYKAVDLMKLSQRTMKIWTINADRLSLS